MDSVTNRDSPPLPIVHAPDWTGPAGTRPPPTIFRRLLPTTTGAFFVASLLATLFIQGDSYLTSDTGWHIAAGEWILAHGFPSGDPFTWTHRGATWHLWEWLWEVAAALTVRTVGLPGLVVLAAALVVLPFAIVHERLRRRQVPPLIAFPVCALALSAAMIHAMARPHVVSWLFVAATAILLDRTQRGSRTAFALMVGMMIVWVNVHSGFVYGLTYVAASWLAALLDPADSTRGRPADRRRLALLLACLLAASLINPQGPAAITDVVGHLHAGIMDITQEFRSPDFHTLGRPFGWFLGLSLALIGLSPLRLTGREGILIGIFTLAALHSARNIPLAALILVMPVARLATALIEAWAAPPPDAPAPPPVGSGARALLAVSARIVVMDRWVRGNALPVVTLAVLLAASRWGVGGPARPWEPRGPGRPGEAGHLIPAGFSPDLFPVEALAFARRAHLSEGLFNEIHWGGYVTYATGGAIPVYIDNRSLLYEPAFIDEYFAIIQAAGAWDDAVRRRGIRWFLIPVGAPLCAALAARPAQWSRIYSDTVAVVFASRGSGAAGAASSAQMGL